MQGARGVELKAKAAEQRVLFHEKCFNSGKFYNDFDSSRRG
jgi:hypothetical protein